MIKSRPVFIVGTVLLVLCASNIAFAQVAPPPNLWTRGTSVNVFAGAARASAEAAPLAGGAVGWELTPWLGVEGSASWLNQSTNGNAFAADLKVLVNLTAGQPVVPFIEGGVGLYRASFDPARGRLPDFYERRMAANLPDMRRITFTDPSFMLGGGVNLFITRHVSVRPDIEAKMVRRDSRRHVVTAVSVHLAYHFEDHPITPVRSRERS